MRKVDLQKHLATLGSKAWCSQLSADGTHLIATVDRHKLATFWAIMIRGKESGPPLETTLSEPEPLSLRTRALPDADELAIGQLEHPGWHYGADSTVNSGPGLIRMKRHDGAKLADELDRTLGTEGKKTPDAVSSDGTIAYFERGERWYAATMTKEGNINVAKKPVRLTVKLIQAAGLTASAARHPDYGRP